jgi:hypothetical protein
MFSILEYTGGILDSKALEDIRQELGIGDADGHWDVIRAVYHGYLTKDEARYHLETIKLRRVLKLDL